MKAKELYQSALAMMPNAVEDEFMRAQFFVALNLLLGECWHIENGLREAENRPTLTQPQRVKTMEDTLDADWRVCNALIYGVAGSLYGRDEPVTATGYLNKYEYERDRLVTFRFVDIVDVYGGGADV